VGGRAVSMKNYYNPIDVQDYEVKTLSKVVTFHKEKDVCILNKNSGDGTLNLVLHASIC